MEIKQIPGMTIPTRVHQPQEITGTTTFCMNIINVNDIRDHKRYVGPSNNIYTRARRWQHTNFLCYLQGGQFHPGSPISKYLYFLFLKFIFYIKILKQF